MPNAYADQIKRRLQKPGQQGDNKLRNRLAGLQYFKDQRNQPASPIPYSGAYETTVASATDDLNQGAADIAGRRTALASQYGIDDTSNPYSLARQLEQNYKQTTTGTNNSYAASGQLYAGSLQNAQNANRSAYGQSQDELLRRYQAEQAQLTSEEAGGQRAYRDTVADAEATRLEDALNTPTDPAEAAPMPQAAKALLQRLRERAQQAQQSGKKNQAEQIRDRLRRLQG